MKKISLVVLVALAVLMPLKADAYWRGGYGGGGCCYGRGGFGFGIDLYAPVYPPVYGGYAYPAPYYAPPPVVYAPPPTTVYADPAPSAPVSSNQECREYRGPIVIGGKTEQGYGTACRQSDGSWHMVSQQ